MSPFTKIMTKEIRYMTETDEFIGTRYYKESHKFKVESKFFTGFLMLSTEY